MNSNRILCVISPYLILSYLISSCRFLSYQLGYFKHTLTILQCVCKRCSRVLIPPDQRQSTLKKLIHTKMDALARAASFKKVVEQCKRAPICPYCRYR